MNPVKTEYKQGMQWLENKSFEICNIKFNGNILCYIRRTDYHHVSSLRNEKYSPQCSFILVSMVSVRESSVDVHILHIIDYFWRTYTIIWNNRVH